MSKTILEVKHLSTQFGHGDHANKVVNDVSFSINEGETFCCLVSLVAVNLSRLLYYAVIATRCICYQW